MGDSTVDNYHDPSEEVLNAGRGLLVLSCLSSIVFFLLPDRRLMEYSCPQIWSCIEL